MQSGSIGYGQGWKIYSDICGEVSDQDNDKLIAAAPELLEALQRITPLYEALMRDCGIEHKEMIAISNAAINKALGG